MGGGEGEAEEEGGCPSETYEGGMEEGRKRRGKGGGEKDFYEI